MIPLFSEGGLHRFNDIVKPGLLCVFDFDGTLSPIVAQPHKAHLPLAILQRLEALSALAPIAIVTGRSLEDIQPRLGFAVDFIAGNHGLEGLPGQEQYNLQYQSMCGHWRQALMAALEQENLSHSGIWIEDKGC